jgi:glucosamine 6-phosphate synthetase-like amidotransferase/phosphosugar isomerase protein
MICHNGVVANHASLIRRLHLAPETDCDTEVLGLLIAHRFSGPLVQRAARAAEATDGKLAILGVWRKPARLLIVRRGNPLCMGETKDGLYFGSLPGAWPGRVRSMPHGTAKRSSPRPTLRQWRGGSAAAKREWLERKSK